MAAKEKANELIDRFISIGCLFASAKQFAIVCVEETLKAHLLIDKLQPKINKKQKPKHTYL